MPGARLLQKQALRVDDRLAFARTQAHVLTIAHQLTGLHIVVQMEIEHLIPQRSLQSLVLDREQGFDPAAEIPRHQIGTA